MFLGKYGFLPLLGFKFAKDYFLQDVESTFLDISEKYNFNYNDYNKAMDILERANKVGKFEELFD